MQMTEDDNESIVKRPTPRHQRPDTLKKNILRIRNILNIVFMILAVAGLYWCWKVDYNSGIYIIFAAMTIKFVEAAIRFLKL